MISSSQITAVILAGGAGKRFGGLDKGLQDHAGKPLVEHVIEAISPQVEELLICVNRNTERYEAYGHQVLKDRATEYQGPLAGLSTAINTLLLNSESAAVVVSSCDSPNLSTTYVKRLSQALGNHHVAVAHDGERRQNLHCLISRTAWGSLIDFFEDGGRAMHRWFQTVEIVDVDFSNEAHNFRNMNVLSDLTAK